MLDDSLTLTAQPAPLADAVAGEATLTAIDEDGEVVVYLRTEQRTVCLNPPPAPPVAPVAPPAVRLTSPGYYGPTVPRSLVHAEHVVGCMGVAPHAVAPGAPLEVRFRLVQPGTVGWAEIGVYASNADNLLRRVASVDVTGTLGYPAGTHVGMAPTVAPIAAGETLWATVAVWTPPGQTAPTPILLASAFPDPLGGGVLRITGDNALVRPSQTSQPIGADPIGTALPWAMTVLLP